MGFNSAFKGLNKLSDDPDIKFSKFKTGSIDGASVNRGIYLMVL